MRRSHGLSFIAALALVVGVAAPLTAEARMRDSVLDRAKLDAATGVAEAAAHAVLIAALSGRSGAWTGAPLAGGAADDVVRADPSLYVGPYDAWVVIGAFAHRDAAFDEAAALAEDGVPADVIRTYDGAYEVTLGVDRFAKARRALKSWRRIGIAGPASRLSNGAHYQRLIWSAPAAK